MIFQPDMEFKLKASYLCTKPVKAPRCLGSTSDLPNMIYKTVHSQARLKSLRWHCPPCTPCFSQRDAASIYDAFPC